MSPDRVISRWAAVGRATRIGSQSIPKGPNRMWTKPEYTEMRFGFEVTMYIATR